MSNRLPCDRKYNHRHYISWVNDRGRETATSDRCRSLMLWSTLAFHILAGDTDVKIDGEPFSDRGWAEGYLAYLESEPLMRGTARRLRTSLARRAERTRD